MVLYDLQGRISLDYLFMEDGTPIIQGAMMTEDGWPLYELTDHKVPIYSIISTLPLKTLADNILSYNITVQCINNADPGRELHVSIDMPPGFEVIESMSDEGEYNQDTGKFSCYLNNDGIATLNLLVDVFGTGSETQTASLDGTDVTLISNCDVYTTDSDGGIAFREVDLTSYPDTLANMQDGKLYTVVSYTKVIESGVTGIHDGVRNNRLSVINVDKINNFAHANIALGTDVNMDITGYSSHLGAVVTSSTEWYKNGSRSWKVECDGTQSDQGVISTASLRQVVEEGKDYTVQTTIKGASGSVKVHLQFYNATHTITTAVIESVSLDGTEITKTITGTAPEGTKYVSMVIRTNGTQNITFYYDEIIIVEGSSIPEYDYMDINGDLIIGGEEFFGSQATLQNSIQKQTCTFIYDSTKELYIRQHDQYKAISTTTTNRWYGLCINEGFNTEYSPSKELLSHPEALFDDTGSAELTLEGNSESVEYIYQILVPSLTGNNNPFYNGIELHLNTFTGDSNIEVYLESDNGSTSQIQSTYINHSGSIQFGGTADLWGLTNEDLNGATLSIHFKVSNSSQITQTFSFNNLTAYMYYQDDKTGGRYGFSLDGVHSRNYNIILSDDDNPSGLSKNISTLELPKTDGVLIIDDTGGAKKVKLTCHIRDSNFESTQRLLNNITKWMSSNKNEYNIPLLKSLILDYDPTKEYFVVLNDQIDVSKKGTWIKFTATFLIPSGTAKTTEQKITGHNGVNNGLTKIRPVIVVEADGSSSITLTDTVNTSLKVGLNVAVATGTVLTIDCEERTITDEAGTDYTGYITLDTVWPAIPPGEYSFNINGGQVRYIAFNEEL